MGDALQRSRGLERETILIEKEGKGRKEKGGKEGEGRGRKEEI